MSPTETQLSCQQYPRLPNYPVLDNSVYGIPSVVAMNLAEVPVVFLIAHSDQPIRFS